MAWQSGQSPYSNRPPNLHTKRQEYLDNSEFVIRGSKGALELNEGTSHLII